MTWYHDGVPIDFNISTIRNIWRVVLPKNVNGILTALLNVEKAHALDAGIFTCRATDWGFTLNKSIEINVKLLPNPVVTPLTATVFYGNQLLIFCYSPEDNLLKNFGYTWLKNGELLNPLREKEIIEDLYPTGSRLLIHGAEKTTTYTCIVSSAAGATHKNSIVTIVPNKLQST